MRKLMKSIFMGAAMLALPMMLTSCEGTLDDVFGQWDRPSKIPAEVFMFKKVLDNGSTLTVKLNVNGTDMTFTFKKEGDKYKVQGDGFDPDAYQLQKVYGEDLLDLSLFDSTNDSYLGEIFFSTTDGSYYILNFPGQKVTFDGKASVNGISGTVTNICPDEAIIDINSDDYPGAKLTINYNKSKNETWNDIVKRYHLCSYIDGVLYTRNGDGLFYSETGEGLALELFFKYASPVWNDNTRSVKTLPTDKVGVTGPYYANCTSPT